MAPAQTAVVLWWGSEIRILGPDGGASARSLQGGEDPVGAILEMMKGCPAGTLAARIAYHPASLEVREVGCADSRRSRIFRALSREFPVMKAAGTLWAVDSTRSCPGRHGSLLYIDMHSRLPALVDGLARLGIRTEGAWPLQALVEAGFPLKDRSGAFWALVSVPGRALVACASANGERFVRHHHGPSFAEEASADVGTTLALLEGDRSSPGLCAVEDGPGIPTLLRALGPSGAEPTSIDAFLGRARLLSAGDRSDFLSGPSVFQAGNVVAGLAAAPGILLMAGSAWFAAATWRDQARMRRSEGEAGRRLDRLRVEVASLRGTENRIVRLERALDQLRAPPQRAFELLGALSRLIPPQVVVQEISIQGGGFVLRGRCEDYAADPGGALAKFRHDLGAAELPWTLAEEARSQAGPDFLWHGDFR